MPQVFTLANAKGGCGKSTVALNLAICFARAGYRTLAVDLDQQGNLSAALGVDLNNLSLTTHRMLVDEEAQIEKFLIEVRPRLKLLPNTIDIDAETIALGLDDAEIAERLAAWQPPALRDASGVFARYRALVGSASEGAVLQPRAT